MIKLGEIIKDKATGLKGMLTHLQIELNKAAFYRFQPSGLNPETGLPVDGMWIAEDRIVGGNEISDADFPLEVLGTVVEDKATGFKGIAVSLIMHLSGCIHVNIQPQGTLKKTGAPIQHMDFDIRRCKGKALKEMSDKDVEKAQKRKPSPAGMNTLPRFSI